MIIRVRRRLLAIAASAIVLALVISCGAGALGLYGGKDAVPVIIIDPGHGGIDGGAVARDGTLEKDLNLSISLKLETFLKLAGYRVVMTRRTDVSLGNAGHGSIREQKRSDLRSRLGIINSHQDAICVSIHMNKFGQSRYSGAQVFFSPGREEDSALLARCVQEAIVSLVQPENTRQPKEAGRDIYLLYNASIPAVIIECGFLSNDVEAALLKNEDYQSRMAFAVFCGVASYLGAEDA